MARKKKEEVEQPAEGASLDATIARIKKEQNTSFIRLGSKASELRPVLPTGIFALDHWILGSGGFPKGRIVELFGNPSSGKGTLVLQAIANTQRLNPDMEIAYTDAEHALDPAYAHALGVDTDRMLLAQPDAGEEALQATLEIIETGKVGLAVVDSVASLVPRAELEGSMTDAHMGLQARMLGKALRKMTATVSRTGTCLVFINQLRSTLASYGAQSATTGGKALPFFASIRLEIARIQAAKQGEKVVGNDTKITAKKNKTAIPFREFNVDLIFGSGFDGLGSLVDMAVENKVIAKSGAQYTLPQTGETLTGRNKVRALLDSEASLRKQVEEETLRKLGHSDEYIKRALRTS